MLILWRHTNYITSTPPSLSYEVINANLYHQHHCLKYFTSLPLSFVIWPYIHHHHSYLKYPMLPLLPIYLIITPCLLLHHNCLTSIPPPFSSLCTTTIVSIIPWLWAIFSDPFFWVKLSAVTVSFQSINCPQLLPRLWPSPYIDLCFICYGPINSLQYDCSVLLTLLHYALILSSYCYAILFL